MKTIVTTFVLALCTLTCISQSLLGSEYNNFSKSDEKTSFIAYSSTTINSTEELTQSINALQKFDLEFFIFSEEIEEDEFGWSPGLSLRFSMNTIHLKPTSFDKDSIDVTSLMFPETGNTGFMANPRWTYFAGSKEMSETKRQWVFGGEGSIAFRQNRINFNADDSTSTANFGAINYNFMPLKFSYLLKGSDDFSAQFSLGLYWNLFNIPQEDAAQFNSLFNEDPVFANGSRSAIRSFGMKASFDVSGFGFFVDLRQNYTTTSLADDNPFKGIVYNFGLTTSTEIFKK